MSNRYQESTGLIIPSIHHVGFRNNPTPTEIKRNLNEKYQFKFFKYLLEDSISTSTFSRSGAVSGQGNIIKKTSLKKSLSFLTQGLKQDPDFIIPNLGCYLAGDLTNRSYLVSGNRVKQEIKSKEVDLDPKFEIYYLYFNGSKGCVLKIKDIKTAVREQLRVKNPNRRSNIGANISIKRKHLFLLQDNVEAIAYSLEGDRVVTTNITLSINESDNKIIGTLPLKNYNKSQFNILLRKIRANFQRTNSEKVFSHATNFINDTYNLAFFVPEKYFSENYINVLFLLLIAEAFKTTALNIDFFNIYNYLISEYFLNKIYFKYRNIDSAFDFRDILLNREYDKLIARADTSPRSWTDSESKNNFMKNCFLESNTINFKYLDYVPAEVILRRSGASSTNLAGINLPANQAAGLYSDLTNNFALQFLDAIYKHSTFRLALSDDQFNATENENNIDLSIERKLIELSEL